MPIVVFFILCVIFACFSTASAQTCTSSEFGHIKYNTTNKGLEHCDGEIWRMVTYNFTLHTSQLSSTLPIGRVTLTSVVPHYFANTINTLAVSDGVSLSITPPLNSNGVSLTTCTAADVGKIVKEVCSTSCVVGNSGCGGKFAACNQGSGNATYHLIAQSTDESGYAANSSQYNTDVMSDYNYATSTSNGISNTQLILGYDSTYVTNVGYYCDSDNESGFNDWYLPAESELSTLYTNRVAIGGFSSVKYWSSTTAGYQQGRAVNFSGGAVSSDTASNSYRSRCVRRAYTQGVPKTCVYVQNAGAGKEYKWQILGKAAAGSCLHEYLSYGGHLTAMPNGMSVSRYESGSGCYDISGSCSEYLDTVTCTNGKKIMGNPGNQGDAEFFIYPSCVDTCCVFC